METKFNFKSQICTDRNSSERLLALGLKKETADMGWVKLLEGDGYVMAIAEDYSFIDIPAWSLHRLIEMMPESLPTEMTGIRGLFHISRHSDMTFTVGYTWSLDMKGSLYDVMISAYEWLIKEAYFNKEYLVV